MQKYLRPSGISLIWVRIRPGVRKAAWAFQRGQAPEKRAKRMPETVLVAVSPDGRILRVELLAFREPQDYIAKEAWLRQFDAKRLEPQLSLKGAIRPLAGSTLTANALVDAARRGLALEQVLYGEAK